MLNAKRCRRMDSPRSFHSHGIPFVAVGIAAWLLMLSAPMPATGAAQPTALAGPVIVPGQLTVENTGEPVAAAPLHLIPDAGRPTPRGPAPGAIVQTLANGSFVIRAPHPGKYRVIIDVPEFFPLERELDVPPAGLTGLNLQLKRPPTLELTVTTADGRPVSSDTVQAWLIVTPREQPTAARLSWITVPRVVDGRILIAASRAVGTAAPGAFGVSVRVPGMGYGVVSGVAWPTQPVAIRLQPGVSASGRVVGADGKPVAHVQVSAGGATADLATRFLQGWEEATTDDNGAFTLTDLAPGRYEIRTQFHDGYRSRLLDAGAGAPPVTLSDTGQEGPVMSLYGWNGIQASGGINLMLVQPLGAPAGALITVSGHVLDHGVAVKPVEGVPVAVYVQSDTPAGVMGGFGPALDTAVSNKDGSVSIQVPGPGTYRLTTGYGGWDVDYAEVSHAIKVPPGGLDNQVFAVSTRPTLQVRVLTADGKPVVGKQVEISASVNTSISGYGFSNNATTDANGIAPMRLYQEVDTASVTGVSLSLHANGMGGAHIHLDAWPNGPVDIKLVGGRTIAGHVFGPGGQLVDGVTVSAQLLINDGEYPSFETMGSANSGADGAFTLTSLPSGYYVLVATSDKGTRAMSMADARNANPLPARLQLGSGLTITGTVLDGSGAPVSNIQVRVFRLDDTQNWPNFGGEVTPTLSTDMKGSFRLAGLSPGFYYLSAQTQDGNAVSARLELTAGKPANVLMRFKAGLSAAVRVMDAAGKPVAGVQVRSYRMTEQYQSPSWAGGPVVATGDDGRCVLNNLAPGQYLLVATAPGMVRAQRLVVIGAHTPEIILTPGDHL